MVRQVLRFIGLGAAVALLIMAGGLSISSMTANAQSSPSWVWAQSSGQTQGGYWNDDEAFSVAVDKSGNTFITGQFWSQSVSFGSTTLTYAGFFLVKYDTNGNVVWAKDAGSDSESHGAGYGIAVDPAGNVYVTGEFKGNAYNSGHSVDDGGGRPDLSLGGGDEFFVRKYDTNGNLLWTQLANGSGDGRGIAVDPAGNVYVTGDFEGNTITFGGTTLTNPLCFVYNGSTYCPGDFFLVKYDTNGNVVWVRNAGGSSSTYGMAGFGIAVDQNGNSYITGAFVNRTINFGSITLTHGVYPGGPGLYCPYPSGCIFDEHANIFVVKYDTNGNVLWAQKAGPETEMDSRGLGIAIDSNGNAYITGYVYRDAIYADKVGDVFVAKYDTNGNVVWANEVKGGGECPYYGCTVEESGWGLSVVVGANGNAYVTGRNYDIPTLRDHGIFVAEYNSSSGETLWTLSTTGDDNGIGLGIAVDPAGNFYVTGGFCGSVTFGSITLTPTNGCHVFVAKMGP